MIPTDADLLDGLVARLFAIRERFGGDAYREAILKSAVAVARVALVEAERRALSGAASRKSRAPRFRRPRDPRAKNQGAKSQAKNPVAESSSRISATILGKNHEHES